MWFKTVVLGEPEVESTRVALGTLNDSEWLGFPRRTALLHGVEWDLCDVGYVTTYYVVTNCEPDVNVLVTEGADWSAQRFEMHGSSDFAAFLP